MQEKEARVKSPDAPANGAAVAMQNRALIGTPIRQTILYYKEHEIEMGKPCVMALPTWSARRQ